MEIEAKGRVYHNFLADTLAKEVAERRYGYWTQLAHLTRTSIPSLTEDGDSEMDEEGEEEEE